MQTDNREYFTCREASRPSPSCLLQTGLQIENCKLKIENCKLQIANWKLKIANWKLQTANCKLQIANCNISHNVLRVFPNMLYKIFYLPTLVYLAILLSIPAHLNTRAHLSPSLCQIWSQPVEVAAATRPPPRWPRTALGRPSHLGGIIGQTSHLGGNYWYTLPSGGNYWSTFPPGGSRTYQGSPS